MNKYELAINEWIENGNQSKVNELLDEAKVGRPPTPQGHSIQNLAGGALAIAAIWKLFQGAFQTSDSSLAGRGINALIGNALMKGNALLASKVSNAAVNIIGGPSSFSGQGAQVRQNFMLNQPSPDIIVNRQQGTKGFPGREQVRMPMTAPINLAKVESNETPNGYEVNLFREDPITGMAVGAPVKTWNISFQGTTPVSIKKMQDDIARTIYQMGEALLHNKAIYHPPIMMPRPPGRPHYREYR